MTDEHLTDEHLAILGLIGCLRRVSEVASDPALSNPTPLVDGEDPALAAVAGALLVHDRLARYAEQLELPPCAQSESIPAIIHGMMR